MKKILVVDNDEDLQELINMILTANGYEVIAHKTGHNVPLIVTQNNPGLILLDIHLPGKSGIEICKELKTISKKPSVLLFSADDRNKEKIQDYCNADGFLLKPFDIADFVNVVKRHAT